MGAKVGRWFLGVGPARAFPNGEASSRPRESGVPLADIKKFEEITGRDKCNLVLQPFWKTDSEEVADEIADFINVRYKDVFQAGGGISQLPLIIHIIGSEGTPPASRAWLDHAVDEASRANPKSMQGVLYALAKDADARIRAIISEGTNRRTTHAPVDGVAPAGAEYPTDRLRALRHAFDSAVKQLDAIPDTELSPAGQPFVKECAEAMLAFAAWFGEQTPDDVAIQGNAYRVQYALGGLSGVIDWVALHWSVPFAKEIDQETGELVEQADAFDQAVVKAFKVPTKRHELRLMRKPLSDCIYADLEQRIQQISGLAYKLGNRLRRVAVWASEGHMPTTGNGRQSGREKTGGLEAQLRTEAVAKGIGAIAAKFANRGNGKTGSAPMNAIHSYPSASTKDQDDSLIAGYALATAGDLLAACNRMIQCLAGFDTVFLMSPKGTAEQASQIDDEWFKGFNRTHETLCLAASARKMDVAPYKRLTNCAYAFWKGAADPKSTETEWKLLFPPGIEVLHNLKRALMVEMAKTDAESQAAFAKGARILDRAHRERCFKEIDAAVKRCDVSAALNIFADDVAHFAGHLKDAVFALMAAGDSARSHRRMCNAKDGSPMRPDFGNDFIGLDQVYAMLEVRPGPEQAMQFARRVNELNEATLALADLCCAYDGPGGVDIPMETMLVIDEARSDVKRHALGLANDMRVWASQLGAGTAGVKMTPQNTRMAKDEANIKARDFLRDHPDATSRELAAGVGCSTGLVSQLPAWKAVKEQRDKGRQPKKAVVLRLTDKLQRTAGIEDESLAKLISEQVADAEPSPLEDSPVVRDKGTPRQAKLYGKR